MKQGILFILSIFIFTISDAQHNLDGVYQTQQDEVHFLWIFMDGYASKIQFKKDTYISSEGGTFQLKGNHLAISQEYQHPTAESVGETKTYDLKWAENGFTDASGKLWKKSEDFPQDLDGLWQISGRQNAEEFVKINHSGSRKTIKLLKDGYFQWIAIEPAQKKFYGTGGGRYKFKNGAYTENILFFSRDNSRVGAKLSFEGEIKNGDWHHRGKSSKGYPLHEVWTKVKK